MSCCGGAQVEDELGQRYRIDRVLGKGKFAVVKACTDRSTGLPYAVKMIFKESVSKIQSFELRTEVEILRKLDHPNIIKLHDVFETSTHLHLVIELATGGELFDRIISKGYYSENDAARVVMQLASALQYMHSHGVTHRDLKPENLLYARPDSSALIKITDFGLAKLSTADDVMRSAVGTPGYVAPEVISGSAYGPEVDVWSLGVILYIMLCGFAPFNDSDLPGLFHKILRADYSFPSPGVWDSISDGAKDVVRSMLVINPAKRVKVGTLMTNPWVTRENARKAQPHLRETVEGLQVFQKNRLRTAGMSVIAAQRMRSRSLASQLAVIRDSILLPGRPMPSTKEPALGDELLRTASPSNGGTLSLTV